eukprot:gene16562-16742_t
MDDRSECFFQQSEPELRTKSAGRPVIVCRDPNIQDAAAAEPTSPSSTAMPAPVSWQSQAPVWRFMTAFVIVITISSLAWPVLPRRYEASSTLILHASDQTDQAGGQRQMLFDESAIQSEMDRLSSSLLLQQVAERLRLNQDAEFTKGSLFSPKADRLKIQKLLQDHLNVSRERRSYTLKVTFRDVNPERAKALANSLVAVYIDDQLARQRATITAQSQRLVAQRDEIQANYSAAQQAVREAMAISGMSEEDNTTDLQNQLSILSGKLAQTRVGQVEAKMQPGTLVSHNARGLFAQTAQAPTMIHVEPVALKDIHLDLNSASPGGIFSSLPTQFTGEMQHLNVAEDVSNWQMREGMLLAEIESIRKEIVQRRLAALRLDELRRTVSVEEAALNEARARVMTQTGHLQSVQPDVDIVAYADSPQSAAFPNPLLFILGTLMAAALAGGHTARRRAIRGKAMSLKIFNRQPPLRFPDTQSWPAHESARGKSTHDPIRMLFWHWGQGGGGSKFTYELVQAISAQARVEPFLSAVSGAELAKEADKLKVPLHEIQTFNGNKDTWSGKLAALGGLARLPQIARSFDALLEGCDIDIAVCTMQSIWDLAILAALRRRQVPFLLFLHDAKLHDGDRYPLRQYLMTREVAAADGLVALSEHVRREAISEFNFDQNRIWVLPHGAFHFGEEQPVARRLPVHRPARLLFFGRILPYKGLGLLLDAYKLLRAKGISVELDIVGSGDLHPYAHQLADLTGITLVNKWLNEREIAQALDQADIMVLPYVEASQSGVAAAATSAGIPIIATPVGGLTEQVSHGKTGLLALGVSAEDLADAIRRIMTEPGLYEQCSNASLDHAQAALSWDGIGSRLVEIAATLIDLAPAGVKAVTLDWLSQPAAYSVIVPVLTVLGAGTTLLAPMLLAPTSFGAFALLTSLFQYASASDMGLSQFADRHLAAKGSTHGDEILRARWFIAKIILFVVTPVIVAASLAGSMTSEGVGPVNTALALVAGAAFMLANGPVTIHRAALRVGQFTLAALVLQFGMTLPRLFGLAVGGITGCFAMLAIWYAGICALSLYPQLSAVSTANSRGLLRQSLPLFAFNGVWLIYLSANRWISSVVSTSPLDLGLFAFAAGFVLVAVGVINNISQVRYPHILAQLNAVTQRASLATTSAVSKLLERDLSAIGLGLAGMITIVAPLSLNLIKALFPHYVLATPATLVLAVSCIPLCIVGWTLPVSIGLSHRPWHDTARIFGVPFLLLPLGMWAGQWTAGIVGQAWGCLVSSMTLAVLQLDMLRRVRALSPRGCWQIALGLTVLVSAMAALVSRIVSQDINPDLAPRAATAQFYTLPSPKLLAFEDRFDTLSLWNGRRGTWEVKYPWGGRTNPANNEQEYYVDPANDPPALTQLSPFSLDNGLVITARPIPRQDRHFTNGLAYASGMLNSAHSVVMTYGYFEIRARVPEGRGLWPAFWLIPQDQTWPPELDVFETHGQRTKGFWASTHWATAFGRIGNHSQWIETPDLADDFHDFGVEWGPDELIWVFDGRIVARMPTPPDMHKPMYMVIDFAVGGKWPGYPTLMTHFPASLHVRYKPMTINMATNRISPTARTSVAAGLLALVIALAWILALTAGPVGYALPVTLGACLLSGWVLWAAATGHNWALSTLLAVVVVVPTISFQSRGFGNLSINPQNSLKLLIWAAMAVVCFVQGMTINPETLGRMLKNPLIWPLIAFGLAGLLSTLYSPTPGYTAGSAFGFLAYTAFACLIALKLPETLIFKTLAWSFAVYIGLTLGAALLLPDISWVAPDDDGQASRLQGLSSHPNMLAKEMAAYSFLILPLALKQNKQLIASILVGMGLLILLASGSRTSLLAMLVAFAAPSILHGGRFRLFTAGLGISLVAIVLVFATGMTPDIQYLLGSVSRTGDLNEVLTATGRTELWGYVWQKILASPVFGYGFNSAEFVLEPDWWGPPDAGIGAHDALLQSLLTLGVIGTSVFVLWHINLIRRWISNPDFVARYIINYIMILGLTEVEIAANPVLLAMTTFLAVALDAKNQRPAQAPQTSEAAAITSGLSILGMPSVCGTLQRWNQNLGTILMFHRVRPQQPGQLPLNKGMEITPETLDFVLGYLRLSGHDIISIDTLRDRMANHDQRRRFAVLTFDDGYRDNMTYALPILRRHAAPFTVYVTGKFASGEGNLWWHLIEQAIMALPKIDLDTGHGTLRLNTETFQHKAHAAEQIYWTMRSSDEPLRAWQSRMLADQAGLNISLVTRDLCMNWQELAMLAEMPGCTIGAHTITHPVLSCMDEPDVTREMVDSRSLIRRRLGMDARHFSYPFGDCSACGTREFNIATDLKFETAVTTRKGVLFSKHETRPTSMPRLAVNGHWQQHSMIEGLLSAAPLLLKTN